MYNMELRGDKEFSEFSIQSQIQTPIKKNSLQTPVVYSFRAGFQLCKHCFLSDRERISSVPKRIIIMVMASYDLGHSWVRFEWKQLYVSTVNQFASKL